MSNKLRAGLASLLLGTSFGLVMTGVTELLGR